MTASAEGRTITVLIVDDHEAIAQALAVALRDAQMRVAVVDDLAPPAVLDQIQASRPRIVLLDLHLGGSATSVELVPAIVATGAKVIVLTASEDVSLIGGAVQRGAHAVVRKSQPFDQLVATIRSVAEGDGELSATTRLELLRELEHDAARRRPMLDRFATLTEREAQVLAALLDGKSAAEAADDQFVAVSTVRSQLKSIYRKLNVNSQLAAVAMARRAGWHHDD